jgi:hypothetical protein
MGFTRPRLLLVLVAASTPALLVAPVVMGQEHTARAPAAFKVYSQDGRESLTASCRTIHPVLDQVTCNFVHVRFERSGKTEVTPGSRLLLPEEILKATPSVAQQLRQEVCLPSSKDRAAIEAKMREPEIGPKRKAYYQRLLAACALKDVNVFIARMYDLERRTCDLWVDQFTLEFKKIREGHWVHQQQAPGLLSKDLKVYELTTGDTGLPLWTLSETRVPTEGATEKPAQTVWSGANLGEYEVSCDFISHRLIQFPPWPP